MRKSVFGIFFTLGMLPTLAVADWLSQVITDDFDGNDTYITAAVSDPFTLLFECKAKTQNSLSVKIGLTVDYDPDTDPEKQVELQFKIKGYDIVKLHFTGEKTTNGKLMFVSVDSETTEASSVASLFSNAKSDVSWRFVAENTPVENSPVIKSTSSKFKTAFKKLVEGCHLPPLPDMKSKN